MPSSPVVAHRFLLALLHSPVGRLFRGVCGLRFVGRTSGRLISLPVQCAQEETRLVIYVGRAAEKHWWRNFIDGRSVDARVGGADLLGHGRVIHAGHPGRASAERIYHRRYPRVEVDRTDPMVVIDLRPADGGPDRLDVV